MNPPATIPAKARPDDTRGRIIETAEALFRRLGFAKTTVADIASELKMSPANVYRFFPSKNAIVEAICKHCLSDVEEKAWAVARSKAPAAQRMERLILEILAYHRDNLVTEQRVNELVVAAIEHSWDTIRAHKEVLRTVTELIVRVCSCLVRLLSARRSRVGNRHLQTAHVHAAARQCLAQRREIGRAHV